MWRMLPACDSVFQQDRKQDANRDLCFQLAVVIINLRFPFLKIASRMHTPLNVRYADARRRRPSSRHSKMP